VPVTVVDVVVETGNVLMLNVADVAPAATVTEAGTDESVVSEVVNVTTAPPAGAGEANATVQTLGEPPTTEVGLSDNVMVADAVIVSVAVTALEPAGVALIVDVVFVATVVVVTVKVAVV